VVGGEAVLLVGGELVLLVGGEVVLLAGGEVEVLTGHIADKRWCLVESDLWLVVAVQYLQALPLYLHAQ
jgi:hypothetical protein